MNDMNMHTIRTNIFAELHTAITRRNIARHRADAKLTAWWEQQARYFAAKLGTDLVELADRPGVLVPRIFTDLY